MGINTETNLSRETAEAWLSRARVIYSSGHEDAASFCSRMYFDEHGNPKPIRDYSLISDLEEEEFG